MAKQKLDVLINILTEMMTHMSHFSYPSRFREMGKKYQTWMRCFKNIWIGLKHLKQLYLSTHTGRPKDKKKLEVPKITR